MSANTLRQLGDLCEQPHQIEAEKHATRPPFLFSASTATIPIAPAFFQVILDLHLETSQLYDFDIKQTAPNIALLGDIGQVIDDGVFIFLERLLSKYWNVFYLLT